LSEKFGIADGAGGQWNAGRRDGPMRIKVPLHDRETSIDGFCRAIQKLAELQFYNQLSAGALQRARELTWDSKAARISEAYLNVCG
jgi:glycosyltransferase involved in cell wall biosynthesis